MGIFVDGWELGRDRVREREFFKADVPKLFLHVFQEREKSFQELANELLKIWESRKDHSLESQG